MSVWNSNHVTMEHSVTISQEVIRVSVHPDGLGRIVVQVRVCDFIYIQVPMIRPSIFTFVISFLLYTSQHVRYQYNC